jgi:hypothetical protein
MPVTEFCEQDLTGARFEQVSLLECLRIVLNEEWEHRLYAERDLTSLEKES